LLRQLKLGKRFTITNRGEALIAEGRARPA
jgi:hypothetical protein